MPVAVAAPPKYTRRVGAVRPPRASPAPSIHGSRSRSRSSTPGTGPKCTHCGARTLSREDAGLICQSCGVIVQEDSNFRAEVEFDEGGNGGTQVRGTQVRHDQTHQKQYTNRVGNASRVGLESSPAFDNALREARSCIKTTATALRINDPEVDAGLYIFRKAYERQFYRGRTLQAVAMVSLYLAIRRVRRGHKYPLMLIDFAEAAVPQLNVFEMGKMAKELQSKLYLTEQFRKDWGSLENQKRGVDPARRAELSAQQDHLNGKHDYIVLNLQDPEDLIAKFCEKLDFGDKQRDIMDDAVKVAKCMDRDWMTTGRRPAGIAGAAVIIAARMNNYRRTLREVVLVAKVTEITLSKRIEEFKETKRSALSVKDFKNIDPDSVPVDESQMPPSYYRAQPEWQAKQAAKRGRGKRKRKDGEGDTAAEIETGEEPPTDAENESEVGEQDDEVEEDDNEEPPAKRNRVDADGFAVPELPNRTSGVSQPETTPRKRGVGKPKGAKNWKPPPPTEEELAAENELSEDIQDQLRRNASLDPTGTVVPAEALTDQPGPSTIAEPSAAAAPATGSGVLDMYPSPWTSKDQGPPVDSNIGNISATAGDANLDDLDFEDDPDVANCVLSEQERVIKETIWVTENADWLRTEHAKKIKRELKDRELREKGIDPEKERLKKLRRKDGMLRAGRSGDIAYLEEAKNKKRAQVEGEDGEAGEAGEDEPETEEDARTRRQRVSQNARDSVQMMLQQRGTFSRRVDYNKLSQAYVLPGFEDSSESRSESPDRPDPDHFYRMATTRGAQTSAKRRARKTASRMAGIVEEDEPNTDVDRSRSRSKSTSQIVQANEDVDEEEDAEYELDEGTAKSPVPPVSARVTSPDQLPTPAATQRSAILTAIPKDLRPPSAGPDGSESPLSSTHTPAGYGSGAPNTPLPTQLAETTVAPGTADEDNDEGEDDEDEDLVDDEDEEEEPDEDLDQYFAGGEQMMGEAEEVVDDDF